MYSVNKVVILGNIGKEPDIRYSQDGTKVVTMSVATTESWKDKNTNERVVKTEWHRVVIFNQNICDVVEKFAHSGTKVYIEGQLQTRKWKDNTGNDRYTTEIVINKFLGSFIVLDKNSGDESFDTHSGPSELNDDIPF